jgi:hypothetical protein
MEKNIFSNQLKNISYILGYWAIFVVIPFLIALLMYNYLLHNPIKLLDLVPAYIMFYVLFIAPFLYSIPYRLVKPKSKFIFIFCGIILPYLFIYLFIYLFLLVAFRGFGGGIG